MLFVVFVLALGLVASTCSAATPARPNILLAIADDWGQHAGVFGTAGIATPNVDRVAREGVLFDNAFAAAPSCTPSRGAILTGQHPWRLGEGANLHSTLDASLPLYTDLLREEAGYFVGQTRKGWGPGDPMAGGRDELPAGDRFRDFASFLDARPDGAPFCFWFGSRDPHRAFDDALRETYPVDLDAVTVPSALPDVPEVRRDIANYYAAIQRFDADVGALLAVLEENALLDATIVVITSDHGWPFPRGKSHLYDAGTRVPLIVRWPGVVGSIRNRDTFVNLIDLAPTFLAAAGVDLPEAMTGRSLLPMFEGGESEIVRPFTVLAKERHHGYCRADQKGYPSRAIRDATFLYIRNFEPDRWPAGSPYFSSSQDIFSDTDDGPAKQYLIQNANDPEVMPFFLQSFGKRPAEELYNLANDPEQLTNVADDPEYSDRKAALRRMLDEGLSRLADPRATGGGDVFDSYPYRVRYGQEAVIPPDSVVDALGLEAGSTAEEHDPQEQ